MRRPRTHDIVKPGWENRRGAVKAQGARPTKRLSAAFWEEDLVCPESYLERLHELRKLVDISNIADQTERNSDRTRALDAHSGDVFIQVCRWLVEAFTQQLPRDAECRLACSRIAKTACA